MQEKKQKEDCVVIGAGIIGTVLAYELRREGRSVTLMDKADPGMGCSYGNAGHFATEQVFPMPNPALLTQIPGMLLRRDSPLILKPSNLMAFLPWAAKFLWHCRPATFEAGTAALKRLNRTALEDWKALLKETGLEKYLVHRGTLEVFKTARGRAHGAAALESFQQHGVPVRLLSGAEARDRVPALTPDQHGALYFPDTAHCLDPYGLTQALYEKFRNLGGRFLQAEVRAIEKASPEEACLTTPEGDLAARHVFLCAGLNSRPLAAALGYAVPLTAERGYHLMLPRPALKLDYPLTYHERKFVITPMANGIRLAGTVEFARESDPPTLGRARMLNRFAREILPNLDAQDATEWVGCRPTLPDYLPVIDRRDNIFFAFGHSHLGLTQAATTAKLVTDMLLDDSAAAPVGEHEHNPFRITRF
tara:strand:+ start:3663 stop:4922 length:1260 start_codon:yes stop_codon:yes gene_type:complete